MPKLLIFDAFTLLIREKNVANYALLWCKIFSLKIWQCKILDKYHICLLCSITTDIVVQIQHKPRRSLSYILPCVVAAFIINIPRWGEGPAGWTDHDNDEQTRRNFDSFFGNKDLFFFAYTGNVLIMKRASLQILALPWLTRIIFVLKTM